MKRNILGFYSILYIISLGVWVKPSSAITTPQFPACTNPQGQVVAEYSNGTHGIVGDNREFTGKDTVYKLSDETVTQCFCPDNGNGIQTNWLKASGFSDSDILILKNLGWYFVPNGSLWGLDNAPYVAKNSTYTCKAGIGGGNSTDGSSSTSGGVLGSATSILSLASTGDSAIMYGLFSVGTASILLGVILKRSKKTTRDSYGRRRQ